MPWEENCAMDQRLRFVGMALAGEHSMTELCEAFSISRKTGYKWRERYAAFGAAGLVERSHAPKRPAHVTAPALVEAILAQRRLRPSWGPRKIVARLGELHPQIDWPAASTAGELLKRAGLVGPRRLHRRAPPRLGDLTRADRPNHLWAVDHKGWVRLGDGTRCEPLTITDSFSRYLISVSATANTREDEAKPRFEQAFREHGLPDAIRSDNGPPFASSGVTGLTALSVWWAKLGIAHERIDPGQPQQNGRHERFHRTLLEAMQPPGADRPAQQRRFEVFLREYNEERPHEALGQKPPAQFYRPSPRAMPERLAEPDYPADAMAREVRQNGEIRWRGKLVAVSTALAGETVCVEETEQGEWQVRFYARPLGVIDGKTNRLRRLPVLKDGQAAQQASET
ncbi:MAG: IS481 family transposase [Hyphomicrobiales bacterium]|nr:IS481 family transposase [Hyphomicrobiales bacterium]